MNDFVELTFHFCEKILKSVGPRVLEHSGVFEIIPDGVPEHSRCIPEHSVG